MSQLLREGMVEIYTGEGKGKTTAALGLALRAAGYGLRTVIIQFIKSADCGEHYACGRLAPHVTILPLGNGFVFGCPRDDQRYCAIQALAAAHDVITEGAADVVVLDEINCALACGLLSLKEVLQLIDLRPSQMELILTGRSAPYELYQHADLVTEMKAIKHPYDEGIMARKGIDY